MIKELHKSALVANTKSEDKEQRTRRRAWTNWRILKGESKTKGLPGSAGKNKMIWLKTSKKQICEEEEKREYLNLQKNQLYVEK
jgi:hypothetical protein